VADGLTGKRALQGARFALAKFRPTTLPDTLITRPELCERLTAGAGKRLTVVVGSAGAGKSVLLSNWAAARPPGLTSWLSCECADANPVRYWAGFIEALRVVAPGLGADAADLLALNGTVSADVIASVANDAAQLPTGSAIIVDDFHAVAAGVSGAMADLVERWPIQTAQLVLASRSDPPLRLHRLRMAGQLCELRDRDLYFTLVESRELLANFGVEVGTGDLARLHERSEGWPAALQIVALSLRGTTDPVRVARALEIRSHAIADFFIAEVLDQQPPEVTHFMLDTSVLDELTAGACAALTRRQDSAAMLRNVDAANLFLVAADDERSSFRYHHLVRQLLRAELRARDPAREQKLQLLAAEWFESSGDTRQAIRYFLAAHQTDRALALLKDRVAADFLHDPALPGLLDLSMVDSSSLTDAPEQLLALAAHLLTWGDLVRGGQYLDMLERAQSAIAPDSRLAARFATMRSVRHALIGRADKAVEEGLAARVIQEQALLADEWTATVPMILMSAFEWLEDFPAVEREAATALAAAELTEPVKLVAVPGARALAWFESGRLAEAADAAASADSEARRLGFSQHFFAVDYLRVLAGLALERRDLDTAEQLAEHALSLCERGRPAFEYLVLLDLARIWAARGQVRDALANIEAARRVLAATGSILLTRADELEALVRLSIGDLSTPVKLATGLPAARHRLLLARVALAAGNHQAAREQLQSLSPGDLTPRHALVRQILLAAAALVRDDPTAAGILGGVLESARRGGFLNTVVATAPRVTSCLVEHSAQMRPDPFTRQLITAALEVRATQLEAFRPGRVLAEPLTAAELRILKLLPTGTYLQMAATLYISRNTVKTRLRSVYRKLGVTSRAEAIERAVDLRLL
jgi:LuxR family transcriptional regulator, maltose regulon positive regulatory protein